MHFLATSLLALLFVLSPASGEAASGRHFWDEDALPYAEREEYRALRTRVDRSKDERSQMPALQADLERLLEQEPYFLPTQIEIARLAIIRGFVHRGQMKKGNRRALEILRPIMKETPDYPKAWVLAGHAYTNLDDYPNAARVLKRAKNIASDDPWYYSNLGSLHKKQGRHEQAFAAYRRAIEHAGGNEKAIVAASINLRWTGKKIGVEVSAAELTNLIYTSLETPAERVQAAKFFDGDASFGRDAELARIALALLLMQSQQTPGNPLVDLPLVEILLRRSTTGYDRKVRIVHKEAIRFAEPLLRAHRNDPDHRDEVYKRLARIEMSLKNWKAARAYLTEARAKGAPVLVWGLLEAEIRYAQGNARGVIDLMINCAEQDPEILTYSPIHAALWELDDREQYRNYYRIAREKLPNQPHVYSNYGNYLLRKENDPELALEMGRAALELSDYGQARAVTAAALRVLATRRFLADDDHAAHSLYSESLAIWSDPKTEPAHCRDLCDDLERLQADFEATHPAAPAHSR